MRTAFFKGMASTSPGFKFKGVNDEHKNGTQLHPG